MCQVYAQQQYYFQEEFNQERTALTLDSDKWVVNPNKPTQPTNTGCFIDTVNETGGILLLRQCSGVTQFPYIISKNNPFPEGNFTFETRIQFTTSGALATGIHLADTAPANGTGFTSLFTISFEEDGHSGMAMRVEYKDQPVYTIPTNSNFHIFKVTKENETYKLYFDNQLVFTSPATQEKVKVLFMGNPSILVTPGFPWAWPRIDYIRITDNGASVAAPQPFLDLPWDYQLNGMTFNEASTSITATFDHEYPILSTNLNEPIESQNSVFDFNGGPRNLVKPYSTHDGYDYGADAKTKLNTPILAPADGEASFMSPNTCAPCGNAILIDHKNGFQTRYYHLQPDGLVLNQEGQKITITKGQQIGKVGFTGNVSPRGEAGSHLHFMVIQDKNKDGNFQDNIPDGLVDPFGWQSDQPDPWENYTFNYLGQPRTGNKSYYLFTKKLDNLNSALTSNQAVFEIGKTKLDFPQGSTDQNLSITLSSEPSFTDNLKESLGSILKVEAKNSSGNLVTNFLKNFLLTINFNQFDLNRYNLNTLSIYSSPDGLNWTKENTTTDQNNKTATTSINHLTYFALMADRKDLIPPTTTAILEGEKGTGNNFRSDVKVNLNALDNPNGSGIEFTAYGFDQQPWQPYTTPLTYTNEGNYKINFYSQDKDGNIEEIKSTEFSIDKTPPEAKIEVDQSLWDLKITSASGSAEITKKPSKKLNETTYTLKDLAGNTLALEVFDLNSNYIDIFKLYSLKYNNSPKINIEDNLFDTNYIFFTPKNKPEIKIVNQNFLIKDKAIFIIVADAIKNKTILNILENNQKRKEEKPGLALLKLQTSKGKLEYSY